MTIKTFIVSILTASALFAQHPPRPGGPGGPDFGGPGFGGPAVTGAPFSAVKTDTHQETLTDGNEIQETRTEKIYRDTDGRTRSEATISTPSGTTKTVITIFDPVAGFVAHLNPADSTAVKTAVAARPAGASKGPHSDSQATKADLGTQTIAGLTATGTSVTHTIPAGAIGNSQAIVETREVWISTTLKIPVKVTSTDPLHGSAAMVISNVVQGAQDPALFVIPAGYTVKEGPAHGRGGPDGPPSNGL